MKNAKTIRKLRSPLARELARTARDIRTLADRINRLSDKIEDQEQNLRITTKERDQLKNMKEQTAIDAALSARHLLDTSPIQLCTCGHTIVTHAPDEYNDRQRPCHIHGCTCLDYHDSAIETSNLLHISPAHLCVCGHSRTVHAPDGPNDRNRSCHIHGCTCLDYEAIP